MIKAKKDKKSQKNAVTVTNVYESEPGWTLVGTVHKRRHENTSSDNNSIPLSTPSQSLATENYVPRTRIASAVAAAEND